MPRIDQIVLHPDQVHCGLCLRLWDVHLPAEQWDPAPPSGHQPGLVGPVDFLEDSSVLLPAGQWDLAPPGGYQPGLFGLVDILEESGVLLPAGQWDSAPPGGHQPGLFGPVDFLKMLGVCGLAVERGWAWVSCDDGRVYYRVYETRKAC